MLWLMRMITIVILLWAGFSAWIQSIPRPDTGCAPVCWYQLHLGASYASLEKFFAEQQLSGSDGFTQRQNGRYEWAQNGGSYAFLLNGDAELIRIDAGWINSDNHPTLGHVLLWFGAPDGVHAESEVVANVRRLTVILTYITEEQITVLSLRRISNNPDQFGEMRIHPSDSVLRISRYQGNPQAVYRLTDDLWRGFARYPVTQVCC